MGATLCAPRRFDTAPRSRTVLSREPSEPVSTRRQRRDAPYPAAPAPARSTATPCRLDGPTGPTGSDTDYSEYFEWAARLNQPTLADLRASPARSTNSSYDDNRFRDDYDSGFDEDDDELTSLIEMYGLEDLVGKESTGHSPRIITRATARSPPAAPVVPLAVGYSRPEANRHAASQPNRQPAHHGNQAFPARADRTASPEQPTLRTLNQNAQGDVLHQARQIRAARRAANRSEKSTPRSLPTGVSESVTYAQPSPPPPQQRPQQAPPPQYRTLPPSIPARAQTTDVDPIASHPPAQVARGPCGPPPGGMTVRDHIRATQNNDATRVRGIMESNFNKPGAETGTPKAADKAARWVVRRRDCGPDHTVHEVQRRNAGDKDDDEEGVEDDEADEDNSDDSSGDDGEPPPPLYFRPSTPTEPKPAPELPPPSHAVPASAPVNRVRAPKVVTPEAASVPAPHVKCGPSPAGSCPKSQASIPMVREERAAGRSRWNPDTPCIAPLAPTSAPANTTPMPAAVHAPSQAEPAPKPVPKVASQVGGSDTDFYVDSLDFETHAPRATPPKSKEDISASPAKAEPAQRRLSAGTSQPVPVPHPPPRPAAPPSQNISQEEKPMKPCVIIPAAARRPDAGGAALGPNGPVW